jgi:hypothetical protein
LSKYNGKNKERRKQNRRPIEQRSDKICEKLIQELFSDEVGVVRDALSERIDYSTIDISLNDGLVFVFESEIDRDVKKDLRQAFHLSNIHHKFNGQELYIYK